MSTTHSYSRFDKETPALVTHSYTHLIRWFRYGGGRAPIMVVRHNTVYNHNESVADVQCSGTGLSLAQFKDKCIYDGGVSSARLPSPAEVMTLARPLLGLA